MGLSTLIQIPCHHVLANEIALNKLIPHPTNSPDRNLSKNTGRYVESTNKKVFFFFSSSKINKYYFISLAIILLFSL